MAIIGTYTGRGANLQRTIDRACRKDNTQDQAISEAVKAALKTLSKDTLVGDVSYILFNPSGPDFTLKIVSHISGASAANFPAPVVDESTAVKVDSLFVTRSSIAVRPPVPPLSGGASGGAVVAPPIIPVSGGATGAMDAIMQEPVDPAGSEVSTILTIEADAEM